RGLIEDLMISLFVLSSATGKGGRGVCQHHSLRARKELSEELG
ncbi:hypothetical protein CEXT_629141, partial [Caerostris extrusa]